MPQKKWITLIIIFLLSWIILAVYLSITAQNRIKLATTYHAQFAQYYQRGEFKKALSLAEKAFQIRNNRLGEKHPDTLSSLNNLALIYKAIGRLEEALPLFEKGYRLSEEV